ncbi:MAG: LCP family protein [Spirochaetes bacterium]|nr:LCP family protein [Spirochaetota bacterium]
MDKEKLNKKKEKKDTRTSFVITMGILIILLIVLIYIYVHYYFLGGRAKSYISRGKPVACLFLGLDDSEKNKKADTIIIGIYNPPTKRMGIIFIPRDLRLKVPTNLGIKQEKASVILTRYGLKKMVKVIEDFLHMDIPYHATMDIEGLIKIIDLLGSVEIFVDKPMKYIDQAAGLYIDIPRGIMKVDGLQVMKFIRFRDDERGDIGRIDRQFELMINVIQKGILGKNILTDIKFIKLILRYIDTNINFRDLISLLRDTSEADFKNIEMIRIPGKFIKVYGVDYIEPDEQKTKKIVIDFFKTLNKLKGQCIPSEIKVQVLNGSGKSGVARSARDKLVRNGFNVVEFGNADSQNYQNTIILDRSGNIQKSQAVSRILQCDKIYPKINYFILVDVTVIVGKDYKNILR